MSAKHGMHEVILNAQDVFESTPGTPQLCWSDEALFMLITNSIIVTKVLSHEIHL